jgi:glycosyltransferase involved in cell wall biosynthesis
LDIGHTKKPLGTLNFEDESFADGIIKLLDNPEMAKEMGRMAREWVVKNRSYKTLARELEKRYFELLNIT